MRTAIRNPLSGGQKFGLVALGLVGLAGTAWYFLKSNQDVAAGLKITGYQNVTAKSAVASPGVKLPVKLGDVLRVFCEFSYHGKEQINAVLRAATWQTGDWLHGAVHEISAKEETFTLAGAFWSQTYRKALDLVIGGGSDKEVVGHSYNLGLWLKNTEAGLIAAPALTEVISVTEGGGNPPSGSGFWNVSVEMAPGVADLAPGDQFTFYVKGMYRGPTRQFDYKIELGYDGGFLGNFNPRYFEGEGTLQSEFVLAPPDEETPIPFSIGPLQWRVPEDAEEGENMDINVYLGRAATGVSPFQNGFGEVVPLSWTNPSLSVTPESLMMGQSLRVHLSGCPKNKTFTVNFSSGNITYITTDDRGIGEWLSPVYDPVGSYTVQVTGNGVDLSGSYQVIAGGEMAGSMRKPSWIRKRHPISPGPLLEMPTVITQVGSNFGICSQSTNNAQYGSFFMGFEVKLTLPDGSTRSRDIDWAGQDAGETIDREVDIGTLDQVGIGPIVGRWLVHIRLLGVRSQDDYNNPTKYQVLDSLETYFDVQGPAPNLSLTVYPTTVNYNEIMTLTFSGFTAGILNLYLDSLATLYYNMGWSSGSGQLSLQALMSGGQHTLILQDSAGHTAQAVVQVIQPSLPAEVMLYPTEINLGDNLTVIYQNFTPNGSISCYIDGGLYSGWSTGPTGSGTIGLAINHGSFGPHILVLVDNAGKQASAAFALNEEQPPEGPQFPAPGTWGDGQTWLWLIFYDGSAGWFVAETAYILISDPYYGVYTYYGPYPSGSTG